VSIHAVGPTDRHRIEAMFGRCSRATLCQRFHAPVSGLPPRYLDWVLQDPAPGHLVLVAREGDDVVGIAEAHHGREGAAEVAVLVEDAWQGRGVGAELFRNLLGSERQRGARTVRATVMTEKGWLVRRLARLDRASVATAGTTCEIVVPLARRDRPTVPRPPARARREPATAPG
jgi:GNAT superfamily N-acetyltransferase